MALKSLLHPRTYFALIVIIIVLGWATTSRAVMPDRIVQPISSANMTRMKGSLHPMAKSSTDLGAVPASTKLERMKLVFSLTPAQQASLDALLQAQQDSSSADYHKWLTPEEYASRFGLSQNDIAKVAVWLQDQGFRIVESARSRTYLAFNGTAAQVESAFHTPIHQYSVKGEVRYANASEPALPVALVDVVSGIAGLNNFRPQPKMVKPRPRVTSSVTGNHFLGPGDFATIYDVNPLYNSGIDGTGQTIAVMGQTDLVTDSNGHFSDIVTFRTNAGLSAPNLTSLLIPGTTDPGVVTTDIDEASLDVEWAGAVAKNASVIFVIGNATTGGGAFDALPYAVDHNLAPVISISYGLCEPQLDTATQNLIVSAGQQANAQGQTIVAPAGDGGAADCDTGASATHGLAVDFPASMPYSTAMGGSEFSGDPANTEDPCNPAAYWIGGRCASNDTSATAVSYIPEMVWNDTATDQVLAAGGGGLSTLFTEPSWQAGLPAITNGMRGVPDLSLSASADHDGYLICSQGSCVCGYRNSCTVDTSGNSNEGSYDSTGGTSASVPTFAGVVALLNQKLGTSQGNVNSAIYALALTTGQPYVFHDITAGSNAVPCTEGTTDCPSGGSIGYAAAPGYDLASGLGSMDIAALVNGLGNTSYPNFEFTAASDSLSVTLGSSITDVFTLTPVQGFSGQVNLICNTGSLTGVSCTLPAYLVTSGTVTVTLSVFPGTTSGPIFVQARSAANPSLSQAAMVNLIIPNFTISAASSSLALSSGGSGTDTITVGATNGFSGQVTLACSVSTSLLATTCSVSPNSISSSGTATLTVNGATLSGALQRRSPFSPGGWGMESTFLFAAVLMFPGRRESAARGARRGMKVVLSMVVVALLLGVASCGGGGSNSGGGGNTVTPLSGTVTVTGTGTSAGTLTAPFSNTVQVAVTVD